MKVLVMSFLCTSSRSISSMTHIIRLLTCTSYIFFSNAHVSTTCSSLVIVMLLFDLGLLNVTINI